MNLHEETWFAAKFRGITDSTVMLSEVKRRFKENKKHGVMDEENIPTLVFADQVKLTVLNPFTRKEEANSAKRISYFAEGFGLVEWHSVNKKTHFKLEQVLNQQEWIKMIAR